MGLTREMVLSSSGLCADSDNDDISTTCQCSRRRAGARARGCQIADSDATLIRGQIRVEDHTDSLTVDQPGSAFGTPSLDQFRQPKIT